MRLAASMALILLLMIPCMCGIEQVRPPWISQQMLHHFFPFFLLWCVSSVLLPVYVEVGETFKACSLEWFRPLICQGLKFDLKGLVNIHRPLMVLNHFNHAIFL